MKAAAIVLVVVAVLLVGVALAWWAMARAHARRDREDRRS